MVLQGRALLAQQNVTYLRFYILKIETKAKLTYCLGSPVLHLFGLSR